MLTSLHSYHPLTMSVKLYYDYYYTHTHTHTHTHAVILPVKMMVVRVFMHTDSHSNLAHV
jgi:uncharacterized membrane protein